MAVATAGADALTRPFMPTGYTRAMTRPFRIALAVAALALLAGCGAKGPLFLPSKEAPIEEPAAPDAPPAAETAPSETAPAAPPPAPDAPR